MNKFIIIDWANNTLKSSNNIELDFPNFEEAWEYIYSSFPEEDFQELEVIKKQDKFKQYLTD